MAEREQFDQGKYAAYLDNDSRTYTRYVASGEDQSMPLAAKLGIGAIAAVGAYAIAHRTGAARAFSRFIEINAKGAAQALRQTIDNTGPLLGSRGIRNWDHFSNEYMMRMRAQISQNRARVDDFTANREYDVMRQIRHMDEAIGQDGVNEGQLSFAMQNAFRMRDIQTTLRGQYGHEQVQHITMALQKGDASFLRGGNEARQQIEYLLNQANLGDANTIDAVFNAQQLHRNTNYSGGQTGEWIRRNREKLFREGAEEVGNIYKKESYVRSKIRGTAQATVQDVLDMHSAGTIDLTTDMQSQLNRMTSANPHFGESIFDRNIYVSKDGAGSITGWHDLQTYDDIRMGTKRFFAKTLFGGLFHMRDQLNIAESRDNIGFRIFDPKSVQFMLNAQRGADLNAPLMEPVAYLNGRIRRLMDADAAMDPDRELELLNPTRRMFLTSSRFGTVAKVSRQVAGLGTDNTKQRNWFTRTFDLGNQDRDSVFNRWTGIVRKFWDPSWERNVINDALSNGVTHENFYGLRQYLDKYTSGLTSRTIYNLIEQTDPAFHLNQFIRGQRLDLSNRDNMMQVFRYLGGGDGYRQGGGHIRALYNRYMRSPDEFLNNKSPIGESSILYGDYTRVQDGYDLIHQSIGKEVIRQVTELNPRIYGSNFNFRQTVEGMRRAGRINGDEANQAQYLYSHYEFDRAGADIGSNPAQAIQNVNELFMGTNDQARMFQKSMDRIKSKTNPAWERFSGGKPHNQVEDEYLMVNKAFESETFMGRMGELFTQPLDKMRQTSPLTGRRNMEDFTMLSTFVSHLPMYRLQDALGDVGLGFSDDSMGSPMQAFSSLMLKRFLPISLGASTAVYLNQKTEDWSGQSVSDRYEVFRAQNALNQAFADDAIGQNLRQKREMMLHPGIEQFSEFPGIALPFGTFRPAAFVGQLATGVATGNFNATYDKRDAMTGEEYLEYLNHGVDPQRKGRWWTLGSKTAYRGDRINEFAPNAYRRAVSDWEFSGTDLTAEEKYGKTNFFPTFENPLGVFSQVLGFNDPYYWEKKHYFDRPYLITGSMFNPNTMMIGDIGNATVGQLLKPHRRMHPEYWGDPVAIMAAEDADPDGQRPDSPIVTRFTAGGRVENLVHATPSDYGSGVRYIRTDQKDEQGKATGAFVLQDLNSGETAYVPGNVASQNLGYGEYMKTAAKPEAAMDTRPRAMYAQEYPYEKEIMRRRLANVIDPSNPNWKLQEAIENWTEPLGVYKWMFFDEALGYDPYTGKTVIEKADQATNLSNQFWGMNLGSLGGELSEIGRRFIRPKDGMIDTYNPIQNTMPDWMPGNGYFINFQIGDPYTKIPHGEYRLPGAAYESLNQLHPDETGRYGAFDKFKVLADVAPWSDEYKFWRDYVVDHVDDENIRHQAAEIKRQVARRKDKYEFTPYKFKYTDLMFQEVTITKYLDDYTFLTKELGDQPVRLAGIDVKPAAPGVLESYARAGSRVVIGVDTEENKRISDDTYKTMRAVVYSRINNINQEILQRGLMKESQTDFSAPGVNARFTPSEIREGKRWETMAHLDTPLNTKFLQVRTALEEYERDHVFGKDWATWENFMMTDYVIPGFQSRASKNPMAATILGAGTGFFVGAIFFAGHKYSKLIGAAVGGVLSASASLTRMAHERATGETWIPERRRKENAINEYFDVLKYMKYQGLYSKAREEASQAGYDVDDMMTQLDLRRSQNKDYKQQLENEKRRLYVEQPSGWEDQRKAINVELEKISLDKYEQELPPTVFEALKYREKIGETLYGSDPYGDRMKLARAFPGKDKWFFDSFADAPEAERERILELVPENERRVYKALWGLGEEDPRPLDQYFGEHYLPGPDWSGWRPEFNLDDIRTSVIKNENLDLSDLDIWPDDEAAAAASPALNYDGDNDMNEGNKFKGYQEMQMSIQAVLEGQGLYDVQVIVTPNNSTQTRVEMDYEADRSAEIDSYLRENMGKLL